MTRPMTLGDLDRIVTPGDPDLSPDGRRVAYTLVTPSVEDERNLTWLMAVGVHGGEPVRLTQGDRDAGGRWSPDGRWIAFLRPVDGATQVFLLPVDGGEARQLTKLPEGVSGIVWSPDGGRLAVLSMTDPRGPASDEAETRRRAMEPIEVEGLGYKADGAGFGKALRQQLLVVDVTTGEVERLTSGPSSVSAPQWSPSGDRIACILADGDEFDRPFGNSLWIIDVADAAGRRITDLGGSVNSVSWSPDGAQLVIAGQARPASEEQCRLHLVGVEDGVVRPLAHDLDRNVMAGGVAAYPGARPRFTDDGSEVVATFRMGGCVHLLGIDPATGAARGLVDGQDESVSGLAVSGDVAVVILTTATTPAEVFAVDLREGGLRQLTRHNRELLDEVEVVPAETRVFVAPDGLEIEGWTFGADPGNPKPLLLEIHGGPHNAWGPSLGGLHRQDLVAAGWVVLALNSRGSDGYGAEFLRALHGGWGRNDQADFLSAIDRLVEDGVADPDRLAVCGYSYGGYMTNWLVTQTDRFKAAVSGAGICDLVSFAGSADLGSSFTKAEFGVEVHDKPELYRELSPLTHVNNVTTPMLILHGLADTRTPVGQAEQWYSSLRRRGVEVEMVLYPGEVHGMGGARFANRTDFHQRILDWVTTKVGG